MQIIALRQDLTDWVRALMETGAPHVRARALRVIPAQYRRNRVHGLLHLADASLGAR